MKPINNDDLLNKSTAKNINENRCKIYNVDRKLNKLSMRYIDPIMFQIRHTPYSIPRLKVEKRFTDG